MRWISNYFGFRLEQKDDVVAGARWGQSHTITGLLGLLCIVPKF